MPFTIILNADLNNTETNEDYVYFTAPFTLSIILWFGYTNGHCWITVLTICFIGIENVFWVCQKFLKVLFRY
jgi:hypothetical protein